MQEPNEQKWQWGHLYSWWRNKFQVWQHIASDQRATWQLVWHTSTTHGAADQQHISNRNVAAAAASAAVMQARRHAVLLLEMLHAFGLDFFLWYPSGFRHFGKSLLVWIVLVQGCAWKHRWLWYPYPINNEMGGRPSKFNYPVSFLVFLRIARIIFLTSRPMKLK